MARKAVLEGGKRDEIIGAAMELFFEKGYETTSVRMILDRVGGEIGMFYHYFKSKEELFQIVVEKFFKDYRILFEEYVEECQTIKQFSVKFLEHYEMSMQKYHAISGNMHWTIQYAMSAKTISELKPSVIKLIEKIGCTRDVPMDILAGQFLYAISGTIHSESFEAMTTEQKRKELIELAERLL